MTARIPTPPLKALIQSLATRTNYGVALNDVEDLPEGVKDVPPGLQIWCWEVRDEEHWPAEMRGKMERRRREREEVRRAVACGDAGPRLLLRSRVTGTGEVRRSALGRH